VSLSTSDLIAMIVHYAEAKYGYRAPAAGIDAGGDLAQFGLDSVDAVFLAGELEEIAGTPIEPGFFLKFENLEGALQALRAKGIIAP
jgi:acyl carrier protein